MAHRFFVSPGSVDRGRVVLDATFVHQVRDVLRLRPGARVIVLDNSGWEYEVELVDLRKDTALGRVCGRRLSQTEPVASLTLYQGVLKGDRFEWVLQKGTELGVVAFVPVFSKRSVVRSAQRVEKKRSRWESIIREAAEQSHRGRLPRLGAPRSFAEACVESTRDHDLSLIPWEEATGSNIPDMLRSLDPSPASIALLIGPEGGFELEEVALAQRQGLQAVTLGPRILRAETASLAAATIVLSELGEMGTRPVAAT